MRAIILCGGQGTRLREETEYKPKPLVDVGGRPIVWHIMKLYAAHGVRSFILCLGYKGHMIKEYFLNYRVMTNDVTLKLGQEREIAFHDYHEEEQFEVTLADTGQDAMTGSRVKQVQRYVPDDTVLVTYGDGLADVNVTELLEFHRSHGKLATVTAVLPTSRFGILDLAEGEVRSFAEKPRIDGWSSAGYFVFDRRVFDYFSADLSCVMEREPLERLAADGQLMAYRHDGFFYAMDTYREYLHLNELWASGEAPWKCW